MERLLGWYRVGSSVGAIAALMVANAVPLIGVLFLGWSVWTILIVYWMENGIVGGFNVLKMLRAEGTDDSAAAGWQINDRSAAGMGKAALVPFFLMHYGIFWLVHGVFVFTLPTFIGLVGDDGAVPAPTVDGWTIALAVVLLVIGHGASYLLDFVWGGEYKRVSPASQMFRPYGRLIVLHMTIILGALAGAMLGTPVAALVILVILKTALDLGFHLTEHRRLAEVAEDRPPVGAARV